MVHFEAQNDFSSKSTHQIFLQFYLMTGIKKWAKATVLDFEE